MTSAILESSLYLISLRTQPYPCLTACTQAYWCILDQETDWAGSQPHAHNIVPQEVVTKTILEEKKYKNANWLSEEALQTPEKTREVKGKEEREKYTQLNAEVQGIAQGSKKVFLSEQCKEIEGKE